VPIRVPESMAKPVVEAVKNKFLKKGETLSLDEFEALPTFAWDVSETLPLVEGGITTRAHMTFVGDQIQPVREHIKGLVESGDLEQGTILRSDKFAIEVFFGHPGWTGHFIGYRIDIAPDQNNFTTLRGLCDSDLIDGIRDDFVGPIIVHQMDAETIEITRDANKIRLNLIRNPKVPNRYAPFEAPDAKTFTFTSDATAKKAQQIAQQIIDRSTAYMTGVRQKYGIGKHRSGGQ